MHGNRIHKLDAPVGNLIVDYAATIIGRTGMASITEGADDPNRSQRRAAPAPLVLAQVEC